MLHVSIQYSTPFWGLYGTDTIVWVHLTTDNCPGSTTACCIAPDCTYQVGWYIYLSTLAGPLSGPGRLLSNKPPRLYVPNTAMEKKVKFYITWYTKGIRKVEKTDKFYSSQYIIYCETSP